MKEQLEQMGELRIPTIVLSTEDDVLLLIEQESYKLVFGRQLKPFWIQNFKTCQTTKIPQ